MKITKISKIIIAFYTFTVLYWIILVVISKYSLVDEQTLHTLRLFTQIPLIYIPLVGGLFGIRNSIHWNGTKSVMGRSTLFLSLGLIAWGSGMIIWNYYIFFTSIEIPYPSFADVGYALGLLFLVLGILNLYKAIGIRFALRNRKGKIVLFVVPIIVILFSIYLLIYVARGGALIDSSGNYLKLFFDLLYPLGDVVILTVISLAYLLSRKLLGGVYKVPILVLLVGFMMFYISDFMFSYTTTKETYFNGHLVDFLFTTTMFVLSTGVAMFDPKQLDQ